MKTSIKNNLLSTTVLTTGLIERRQYSSGVSQIDGKFSSGDRPGMMRKTMRRGAGIMVSKTINCPPLSATHLNKIDTVSEKYITRHFKSGHLDSTLKGYFRFGTIASYKPADSSQIGRFSDFQEGTQWDVFRNRTGFYKDVDIEGVKITNTVIDSDNPIVVEYSVNEYCSCSSKGKYSQFRAKLLRERGNDDIGAYAVYDLKKLRAAIESVVRETKVADGLYLIGQGVTYGEKDRSWEVEEAFSHSKSRDSLAVWLGTVFVKSPDYVHEEEVRLLLIDPQNIGRLDVKAPALVLDDRRISDAIVDYGVF